MTTDFLTIELPKEWDKLGVTVEPLPKLVRKKYGWQIEVKPTKTVLDSLSTVTRRSSIYRTIYFLSDTKDPEFAKLKPLYDFMKSYRDARLSSKEERSFNWMSLLAKDLAKISKLGGYFHSTAGWSLDNYHYRICCSDEKQAIDITKHLKKILKKHSQFPIEISHVRKFEHQKTEANYTIEYLVREPTLPYKIVLSPIIWQLRDSIEKQFNESGLDSSQYKLSLYTGNAYFAKEEDAMMFCMMAGSSVRSIIKRVKMGERLEETNEQD